jgi:hypothetical protein
MRTRVSVWLLRLMIWVLPWQDKHPVQDADLNVTQLPDGWHVWGTIATLDGTSYVVDLSGANPAVVGQALVELVEAIT